MRKRILALLLAVIMVLGIMPITILAETTEAPDETGHAEVYIIGRDELIAHSTVSLDEAKRLDVSKYTSTTSGGCTALHAIVATLKDKDLLDTMKCSGGYIDTIGDLKAGKPNSMSGWMYKVNDMFPNVSVAMQSLSDGDEVILFWNEGMDGQLYAEFDTHSASLKTGDAISLKARFAKLDLNELGNKITYRTVADEQVYMELYVNGKRYPDNISYNDDTATLYFSKPGTYTVTAKAVRKGSSLSEKESHIITTPVCVLTVTGEELPSAGGLSKLDIQLSDDAGKSFSIDLKDGQTDYYISAKGEDLLLMQNFTRDEMASANGASVSCCVKNCYNELSLDEITSFENTMSRGNYYNRLPAGDSLVQYVVHSEGKSDTVYNIHIFLDNSSPDAYLIDLKATHGDTPLVSHNTSDFKSSVLFTTSTYLLYYEDESGKLRVSKANDLKTKHDYLILVPNGSRHLKLTPYVTTHGTYTVTDSDGNEVPKLDDGKYVILDYGDLDETVYTIHTTSSDQTGHEEYTVKVKRRPELTLSDIKAEGGELWRHGIVAGYEDIRFYFPQASSTPFEGDFNATIELSAAPGVKMYLKSRRPPKKLTELPDGKLNVSIPDGTSDMQYYIVLETDTEYGKFQVIYNLRVSRFSTVNGDAEIYEHLTTPSQHMVNDLVSERTVGGQSSFGGYTTFYFPTPIKNDSRNPYGIDFIVQGNPQYPNVWSFGEPAQMYVAQDLDRDGEPDKWYALAGSEHYEDDTLWDYQISYTNEGDNKVRWEDNYGNKGYVCGLSSGCDFPDAEIQKINSHDNRTFDADKLTVSGILVGPIKSESTIYAPVTIFGYGDCYPGNKKTTAVNPYRDPGFSEIDSSLSEEDQMKQMTDLYGKSSSGDVMDISWAVDDAGNPVYLKEISFVKAMSAINVDSGIFSEKSPEVGFVKRIKTTEDAENVGASALPDSVTINGREIDLSKLTVDHGLANLTVYLESGETAADVKVDAGERNVILGNRRCTERTFDVDADGRIFRIITQDGEKEPNILVITVKHIDEEVAKAISDINAIGEVTLGDTNAISNARKAYDALTDEQKSLVTNLDTLTAAETRLSELIEELKNIYKSTGDYIEALGTPGVGSVGGEWMALGLARSGRDVPEGYYDNVEEYVNENINDKEQLHENKSTENSRVILALTAAGYDVTDVDGHNLLEGYTDMVYLKKQGINGPIWALIALDSHDYEIPESSTLTRDAIVQEILNNQLADGGWALSGNKADPDTTAMALQALAPYYKTNADVKTAVDKAVDALSKMQNDNGGYSSWGSANSESCAQVIVALTALGIDPATDARFAKSGGSVVDALADFYVDGGGFKHTADGGLNGMATEQGYYALAAYFRFKENKTALYDMSDVTIKDNVEEYVILYGADSTVKPGDSLSICASGDLSKFVELLMDGKTVDIGNYTLKEGSTIVNFKPEYLSSLAVGKHEVTFVYTDGEVSTSLTLLDAADKTKPADSANPTKNKPAGNPSTDDENNIAMYAAFMSGSMICIAALPMVYRKKSRQDNFSK